MMAEVLDKEFAWDLEELRRKANLELKRISHKALGHPPEELEQKVYLVHMTQTGQTNEYRCRECGSSYLVEINSALAEMPEKSQNTPEQCTTPPLLYKRPESRLNASQGILVGDPRRLDIRSEISAGVAARYKGRRTA